MNTKIKTLIILYLSCITALFLFQGGCSGSGGSGGLGSSSNSSGGGFGTNNVAPSNGQGGSTARFALSNNHLYIIQPQNLKVFDVSNPKDPNFISEKTVSNDVETIFPYKNSLFLGTQTGMLIYDITNPTDPTYISIYQHIYGCDPVVAQDNFAYITLRNGSHCRQGVNRLEIIDISDLRYPRSVTQYTTNLQSPHGLGISDSTLIICDGTAGLKVLDVQNERSPVEIATVEGIHTFDVIPVQKNAVVVGQDGIYQYDFSNNKSLRLLSKITIQR